jgi:hypothetical protein
MTLPHSTRKVAQQTGYGDRASICYTSYDFFFRDFSQSLRADARTSSCDWERTFRFHETLSLTSPQLLAVDADIQENFAKTFRVI